MIIFADNHISRMKMREGETMQVKVEQRLQNLTTVFCNQSNAERLSTFGIRIIFLKMFGFGGNFLLFHLGREIDEITNRT